MDSLTGPPGDSEDQQVLRHPLVAAILRTFPGARIVRIGAAKDRKDEPVNDQARYWAYVIRHYPLTLVAAPIIWLLEAGLEVYLRAAKR